MPTEFRLPSLGEGIVEADVLRVLVRAGDLIAVGQPVVTIETEKATVDVPSEVGGTVTTIAVREGQTVAPGAVLFTLDESGATSSTPSTQPPPPPAAVPATGETPPPVAPASPATTPPAAATLSTPAPATAEQMPTAPPPTTASAPAPAPAAPPPPPAEGAPPPFAAPNVRLFAREIGIDIATVRGSGPGGRIDLDDVKRHARERASGTGMGANSTWVPQPLPDFSAFGPVEREPLSRFRRTVARNMATSAAEIPQVTLFATADLTALEGVRRRYRDAASKAGGTLTTSVILVKLVALALRQFPHFNASLDAEAQELVLKRYVHVGLAVDTDRGLAVSVFRDADQKSLPALAAELRGIADRAKENALSIEEMRGASFTITSLETLGVGHFTPLVNWPEVAILGIGREADQPSYEDGELHPRRRMALSLSFDHRVVDGADGARFLRWIVNTIHDPSPLDAAESASTEGTQ